MSGENTVSSDEKALDVGALPPVQYLIIEILAARYRTGERAWTFPSRLMTSLRVLESDGWIRWKSGVVERTCLAWFTKKGLAAAISAEYTPPVDLLTAEVERLEQELARRDQALDEIRALAQVAASMSLERKCAGGRWQDCVACRFEMFRSEAQRILSDLAAALDAHLNKEDDDQ